MLSVSIQMHIHSSMDILTFACLKNLNRCISYMCTFKECAHKHTIKQTHTVTHITLIKVQNAPTQVRFNEEVKRAVGGHQCLKTAITGP